MADQPTAADARPAQRVQSGIAQRLREESIAEMQHEQVQS